MNHVLNDLGETVVAVGAPDSVERAKCEHPALVGVLSKMCKTEAATSGLGHVDSATVIATQLFHRGILSELESDSLLTAAGFTAENAREIFKQLNLMNQDHDRELRGPVLPGPRGPSIEASQEMAP